MDEQAHFGSGSIDTYAETVARIQNAQGLAGAGSVAFAWDPALDELTIHKLHIIRNGQVIDLLAKQNLTVLRREQNLEAAALDGVLTAVLQPEDLRVGDIIDMAFTRVHKDPSLAGHEELYISLPNASIDDVRVRVSADDNALFQWRVTDSLKPATSKTSGQGADLAFTLKDMKPLLSPAGAPARYANIRLLEITGFKSWADLSSVMAPLYEKAATLAAGSPLEAEAARIKAASPDPKVRAAKALELVQDQIRYLALSMDDGGLVQAKADDTWTRRFGDCKGKTALLIALLRELGIEAEPALVSTTLGDGLDQRLPAVENFDHVLVKATIAGQTYWLDGTRLGDTSLDDLETPPFFWALPVQAAKAELVKLTPKPLDKPNAVQTLKIDASAGLDAPAPAHAESILQGDQAVALNATIANLSAEQRDAAIKAYWADNYDFIKPKAVDARFDPQKRMETVTMDGVATLKWYAADGAKGGQIYQPNAGVVGWKADFDRQDGPGSDAPYLVTFPVYSEDRETIVLPEGGKGFTLDGEDIDQQAAGYAFTRKSMIANGVVSITATTRSLVQEFPASQAAAAAKALNALYDNDLYIHSPASYAASAADVAQLKQQTPDSADAYVDRALKLLNAKDVLGALADYRKAVDLDPQGFAALDGLAIADIQAKNFDEAKAMIDRADKVQPDNYYVAAAKGQLALAQFDYVAAIEAFTRALELKPSDSFSQRMLMTIHVGQLQYDLALKDSNALIAGDTVRESDQYSHAMILSALGRRDEALAYVDQALSKTPDAVELRIARGGLLLAAKRLDEAMTDANRSLELKPTAAGYLLRAQLKTPTDPAGALADIEAGLKLDPSFVNLHGARAAIYLRQGEFRKALDDYNLIVAASPKNLPARVTRGQIYVKLAMKEQAAADFDTVRQSGWKNPAAFNNMCWSQTTAGVNLDEALQDCETALGLDPGNAAYLDSRGLALLRLGRYQDAVASYDSALTKSPGKAYSLYGRGLAKLHLGHEGQTDIDAALKADPKIADAFADMGLKPPADAQRKS